MPLGSAEPLAQTSHVTLTVWCHVNGGQLLHTWRKCNTCFQPDLTFNNNVISFTVMCICNTLYWVIIIYFHVFAQNAQQQANLSTPDPADPLGALPSGWGE